MTVWFYTREYSESEHFPETFLFGTERAARDAMIKCAFDLKEASGGWVTEHIDGDHVASVDLGECETLNWQRDNGACDCFQLFSQELGDATEARTEQAT